jgi:hypothetical protein
MPRHKSVDKAHRPAPEDAIGPDSRLRDPAVQAEVEVRVDNYADQVKRHGRIRRWLPRRGSGRSARARRGEQSAHAVCAVEWAAESVRVLGETQ